jgi:16S rRNA (guanine527-N7)-methyltransferase
MGRRAGFLRNTLAILGLANAETEECEMEKAPGGFDVTVFRAFRPLDRDILKGLFRLLAPQGYLAAYKGRREKIDEELSAAGIDSATGAAVIHPLKAPFLDEERNLVVLKFFQNPGF